MKKIYVIFSIIALSVSTQASACDSPKWCTRVPNATNNWSSASYQCGCNDVKPIDNNPKLGEQKTKDIIGGADHSNDDTIDPTAR